LDPNTVAEYLDNVLPPESVGDFERICLESDMHLAEAAACHHVLTMVLGEPADVDPIVRQRMYSIPAEAESRKRMRVEAAHVAVVTEPLAVPPSQVVASPAGVVTSVGSSHITEVPDYLRASSWSGLRGALVALAALLLVGAAVLFVAGQRGWLGNQNTETALNGNATSNGVPTPNAITQSEQMAPPIVDIPNRTTTGEPPAAETSGQDQFAATDPATNEVPPLLPSKQEIAAAPPATSTTTDPGGRYSTPQDSVEIDGQQTAPNGASTPAANEAALSETAPDTVTIPPQAFDVPPTGEETAQALLPAAPATATEVTSETALAATDTGVPVAAAPAEGDVPATSGEEAVAPPGATEEVPAGPAEVGTYLGGKTVLLRHDDTQGGWFRVEPRSAVIAGEKLLALPEFRPKITLISGVHIDVSGGTQLIMRTADEETVAGLPAASHEVPLVEVVYGRIILINTSDEENQVRLKLGSNLADARLARNATLGIEVERQHVPGRDPRQSPAPLIARLYVPDGGVTWHDASGEKSIDSASRWTISEGVTSEIVADSSPPDWIDQEPVVQLSEQRYAAPKIEAMLVSNSPADIQLLELFQSVPQREVKSLVAKSCIHVGEFAPFIEALRDSDQKPNWRTHIETLRAAMALSPESATKVRQALVEQRDRQVADDLYEMLCGYNEEQIGRTSDQVKNGALVRLIDWLEQDSLDYRVLAWHGLYEITGKRLMPDPAANLRERARNIRQWRARLKEGDLLPARSR
jgi:hypothetical protein